MNRTYYGTFSCKIILAPYKRDNGDRMVYLRAIINRIEKRIALGFYLRDEFFDKKTGRVKTSHPNADNFNTELLLAVAKANNIASVFRQNKKMLTSKLFKEEFTNPSDELDLIKFIELELKLRTPDLSFSTIKQHNTVINKLKLFSKVIRFRDINPDLMHNFKNGLIKQELHNSTINKLLKIVKQYCADARKKGHEFEDPFLTIKIKTFKSNRIALTEKELKRIEEYYKKGDIPHNHKKLLRYFLFSCFTGSARGRCYHRTATKCLNLKHG
ncbi:MAG: phage integrase SAM-like domain-containing protein [Bacteroidetes bacterium]|nr:phage integrase SAM-like domain-containing protein [Bacteroidota bacterium]